MIVYLLANLGDMLRQLFAWVASLTEYVVKTAWQRCCEPFRPFILAYVTESVLKTRSRLGDIGHAVLELFKAVVKQMIEEILEICYRSAGWLIDDFVKVIGSYVMALSG